MKIAMPALLLFICVLLAVANPVLADEKTPCKEVLYLAWTGGGEPFYDDPQWVQKIKYPVYIGPICLRDDDTIEYFPVDARFERMYPMRVIEDKVNGSPKNNLGRIILNDHRVFRTKTDLFLPTIPPGPWLAAAARRGDKYFSEFLERKLWEVEFLVFRRDFKALPDLNWRPKFKKLYDYNPDLFERRKLFTQPVREEGKPAEENSKVLIEYE